VVRILFIDDDHQDQKLLKMILPENYAVISAVKGLHGVELIQKEEPDIVLLDIELPDINGLELLKRINALPLSPPVIMLTGCSEIDKVVRAIKMGASDYLTKPFKLEQLKRTIRDVMEEKIKESALIKLKTEDPPLNEIVGESTAIKDVKKLILLYADSESSVLITGESGTGKDVVARTIHNLSFRKGGPFVPKNCGAIPEALLETELFGSQKGAFTGAISRPGSFEMAKGGTLFLDEIGEMTPLSQVKLLRVLEDKTITRVGGTSVIPVDIRILTATNKDLKYECRRGNFRLDLFYRISTLSIKIPPLRERKEDISLLTAYFLKMLTGRNLDISISAMEKLIDYNWPGNIRELKNVLERAVLHSKKHTLDEGDIVFY